MLVSTDDVKRVAGLTDSDLTNFSITDDQLKEHIYDAEAWVERYCMTSFLDDEVSKVSVDSATAATIELTGVTWSSNLYEDHYAYVASGTGAEQIRKIDSSSTSTIVLEEAFTTQVDNTSKINIVYAPYIVGQDDESNPHQDITIDGNNKVYIFPPKNPIIKVDALTINSTSVSTSNIYLYKKEGKIQLKSTAEKTYFDGTYPQLVELDYWVGLYPTPRIVKRAITLWAAISLLIQQIGGTYKDVATFSLPELSGSLGQPYINIDKVVVRLNDQLKQILPQLPVYYKFG